jgi:Ca2+-binding RTX toxin-like protein
VSKGEPVGNYQLWGTSKGLFDAFQNAGAARTFAGSLLYQTGTEFGISNADGSKSFFYGTGLAWNGAAGKFTAGTITRVLHYSSGDFTDELNGVSRPVASVQTAFELSSVKAQAELLAGDDILDARSRAGGAVVAAVLNGQAGNDTIFGGKAADMLDGGIGNDKLYAGDGNDRLTGSAGADLLDGGAGRDFASYLLEAAVAIDLAAGTAGGAAAGDVFVSIEGVFGSNTGNDTIRGSAAADYLYGYGGNDRVEGGAGNDTLYGGNGADRIEGGLGDDRLIDLDTIAANDVLYGGDGKDVILSGLGDDIIDAGTGEDIVKGGLGNDTIYGGPDPDVIVFNGLHTESAYYYEASDFSIRVNGVDGTDIVYSALRIAFDDGTWRYDVPTAAWLQESAISGDAWLFPLVG